MASGGVSRREMVRRRRQAGFVGRARELALFRDNLARGVADDDYQFVFHVSGHAGVGKTALVRQWEKLAVEQGAVTTYVEDDVYGPVEAMAALARQLTALGRPLKDFDKRLAHYRRLGQELAAAPEQEDPHAEPGMASGVLARAGLAGLGLLPGGGAVAGVLDADEVARRAERLRAALGARIKGTEDAALLLDPVGELSAVFVRDLQELAGRVPWVVLFFDTYERTVPAIDGWLRELVLGGRHGELPINVIAVLAGQGRLDAGRWRDALDLVREVPLDIFTEEEVRALLARRGVSEEGAVRTVLRRSRGLPLLVPMAAEQAAGGAEAVEDPSDTAVDLFLAGVGDPGRRETLLACALPARLDEDVYRVVAGEGADDYDWLRTRSFVSEAAGRRRYHDVIRVPMLQLLRTRSPNRWRETHLRLAEAYRAWRVTLEESLPSSYRRWDHARWQELRIEESYHRLCAAPHEALPEALTDAAHAGAHGEEHQLRWARLVARAGADAEEPELAALGERLLTVEPDDWEGMLTVLLEAPHLDRVTRAEIRAERGEARLRAGDLPGAVDDLTGALTLHPEHPWAHASRGEAHWREDRYTLALADYTEATARLPQRASFHARRGDIHHALGRREEAVADYGRALDLRPDLGWAHAHRGRVRADQGQWDAALADFDHALAIDAEDPCALSSRARTLLRAGRFADALDAYDRTLAVRPDDPGELSGRALALLGLDRTAEVLPALDRAIESAPEDASLRGQRAVTLLVLGRVEEALADFDAALGAASDDASLLSQRAEARLIAGAHAAALADLERLVAAEPDRLWHLIRRAEARLVVEGPDAPVADDLARAVAGEERGAWACLVAGALHRASGRPAEADLLWERSLAVLTELTGEEGADEAAWGNLFLLHCARKDAEAADAAGAGLLAAAPLPLALLTCCAALDRLRRLLGLDPDWVAERTRPLRARLG
ncbi:Tetratricopeptide repeat-containing protein [Streptomyces zhaozhouensis]|uniref:Tetratricopeptide repeat-containing protein n=1 Tax=Streptomyces zhaozhouensis TaxID=1300267 RepID=A0A286DSR9_9ACTN|nr:ATP-binding protein [Streptomyces zhaozhouensis]SOD61722.1 Tetratricopeptide repeat-containing protein [Streptomyces zhaozhouensis]